MKIHVAATMGWSPGLILAPLSRRLGGGNTVTLQLLYLEPGGDNYASKRIEETINEIKRVAGMLSIENPVSAPLPRAEPGQLAYRMAESISQAAAGADTVHILAAGGPRLLVASATLLAGAASSLTDRVEGYIVEEDSHKEHLVPSVPLAAPSGETKQLLLGLLARRGEVDYATAAEETGRDPVTAKRLLLELAKSGYAECKRRARRTTCKPTPTLYLAEAAKLLAGRLTR